jgi:hypothetical protein
MKNDRLKILFTVSTLFATRKIIAAITLGEILVATHVQLTSRTNHDANSTFNSTTFRAAISLATAKYLNYNDWKKNFSFNPTCK